MNEKKLLATKHVDSQNGFLCRYVRSNTERFVPHTHDYYEIFLVVKGPLYHIVNDYKQLLTEGDLLFIRDFDSHDYIHANEGYFEFLNLSLTKELLFSVFDYLANDFPKEAFLTADIPPLVSLNYSEKEKLFFYLTELDQSGDKKTARLKIKIILSEIFAEYFLKHKNTPDNNIPKWLEITYEKMKNPKNFIAGVDKMYEISGKTREHLTRSLKIYYNTTPTEFINDLRLEYSANLLYTSNLPIIDICYSCGFENLSWYYKIFGKKFGETPSKYRLRQRNENQNSI